ncbi:MAG: hypothetical protein L3J20_11455 [Flavobacteriaceae bacterium]|nr:hypothetical protein [Flavobacteriaceae bacterium]
MKELNIEQLEIISASGDGQDFVSGILCGVAIGATFATGGAALGLAIVGCAALFGDW